MHRGVYIVYNNVSIIMSRGLSNKTKERNFEDAMIVMLTKLWCKIMSSVFQNVLS